MKRPNKMAATHHLIIIHKMESTIPTNPLSAKNVVEPFPTVLIFHLEPPCHHLVHHCQILEKRTALRHLAKRILSNVPHGVGYVCLVRSFYKIRRIDFLKISGHCYCLFHGQYDCWRCHLQFRSYLWRVGKRVWPEQGRDLRCCQSISRCSVAIRPDCKCSHRQVIYLWCMQMIPKTVLSKIEL